MIKIVAGIKRKICFKVILIKYKQNLGSKTEDPENY